jgi:hypothetical protein
MRDFNYTVNVLVKAYLNNTLEHGKCAACAVGNIIADCKGITPQKDAFGRHEFDYFTNDIPVFWHYLFMTDGITQKPYDDSEWISSQDIKERKKAGHEQVISTGYTIEEMAKIEYAFETAPGRPQDKFDGFDDKWMFNGLMAVVDVLAQIHGIDLTHKEAAKLLFVK